MPESTEQQLVLACIEAQFRAKSLQIRQDAQRAWQDAMAQANALDRAATMIVVTKNKSLIANIMRAFEANKDVQLWGMNWNKIFGLDAPDAYGSIEGEMKQEWMTIAAEQLARDVLTMWRWTE